MSPARIPLEALRIDTPCPADWAAMAGDDRRRFCQGCRKQVYNLSAMPREEAERLVCASAGDLCVRMVREADGTVVTVDYLPAGRDVSPRGWRFWTGVGLAGALLAGLAQACIGRGPLVTRGVTNGRMVVAGGIGAWSSATQPATRPATIPAAGDDSAAEAADGSTVAPTLGGESSVD